MSADRPISKEDVAVLLTSALGQDKSDEVVMTTAKAAGIVHPTFNGEEVRAIFDRLVKMEGLVGVVARFAVSRGDVDKLIAKAQKPANVQNQHVGRPEVRVGGDNVQGRQTQPPAIDILHLIAPALGAEKARDAIEAAAAKRGVDVATGLSYNGALSVLDEMTKVDGIVGVVARFAKARFLLNPNG